MCISFLFNAHTFSKYIKLFEYCNFSTLGIDIDGRREMVAQMIPTIEKAIKRCITFAKALPGFKDLPIEDQIALIKGNLLIGIVDIIVLLI